MTEDHRTASGHRVLRIRSAPAGGTAAAGDHDDPVTDRYAVDAQPGPDARPDPDDSDWLLGPADDDSERLEVAADAVTQALPHGRTAQRRARRRRGLWAGIAAVLVLALLGGAFVARDLAGVLFPPDYDGPGGGRVVVTVTDGASMREIGEELVGKGVVASARGFGSAAEDDPDGRGIQPGYYALRQRMSAAGAVTALLDPATRLGRLDLRSGTQLDDTLGPANSTVPGVLSSIARATCLPDPTGAERCTSVDDLRRTMATTDPAALGVPAWAVDGVRRADPVRRLEGLVAPGLYDVPPGSNARDALGAVLRVSATRLEATGVVGGAARQRLSPYQVLVVASLAEKEGVAGDFGKVSRVIYNRLALPMRLQFDSTINYPLDKQRLLTEPVDRARPGPYNSYLNLGLPPTPIASVSAPAVAAALDPAPGPWVYFVKCQPQGESCFAVTQPEHDANRRLAQQRGAY